MSDLAELSKASFPWKKAAKAVPAQVAKPRPGRPSGPQRDPRFAELERPRPYGVVLRNLPAEPGPRMPRPSGPVGKAWNPFKAARLVDEVSAAAARPKVGSVSTVKGARANAGSVGPVVDTRAGVRRAASMVPGVTPEAKQAAAAKRARDAAERARDAAEQFHEGLGDSGAAGVVRRRRNVALGVGGGALAAGGGAAAAYAPRRRRAVAEPVDKALLPAKAVNTLRSVKGRMMATKPAKNFLATPAGANARTTYQAARSGFQNAPAGFGQQMKAATKQGWSAATPNQKFATAAVMGTGTLGAGYGVGRMHKADVDNDRMIDNALGAIGVGTGAGLARAARQRKAKATGQMAASRASYAEAEALRNQGRSLRRGTLLHRANAAEARGKKLKILSGGSARSAKFTALGALGAAGAGGAMLYQANRPDIERGARAVRRRVAARVSDVRQA